MEKKKLNLKKIKVAKLTKNHLETVKGGGGATNYQCTEKSAIVVFTQPGGNIPTNNGYSCDSFVSTYYETTWNQPNYMDYCTTWEGNGS